MRIVEHAIHGQREARPGRGSGMRIVRRQQARFRQQGDEARAEIGVEGGAQRVKGGPQHRG